METLKVLPIKIALTIACFALVGAWKITVAFLVVFVPAIGDLYCDILEGIQ